MYNLLKLTKYMILRSLQYMYCTVPNLRLARELPLVHVCPGLAREPLRVGAGGGVIHQALFHHPVSERLEVAVAGPGVGVELEGLEVRQGEEHLGYKRTRRICLKAKLFSIVVL